MHFKTKLLQKIFFLKINIGAIKIFLCSNFSSEIPLKSLSKQSNPIDLSYLVK